MALKKNTGNNDFDLGLKFEINIIRVLLEI